MIRMAKLLTCLKRVLLGLTLLAPLTLIASTGLADSYCALPWGMTWDTSVTDFITLLQTETASTDYSLIEYTGGGKYSVTQTSEQNDQSIEYGAEFIGEVTSKKLTKHTLQEIANQHLRMTWMCISYWPKARVQDSKSLTNGDAISKFEGRYNQFQQQYGKYTAAYSYIKITNPEKEEWYQVPENDGSIDYHSISRYIQTNINTIGSCWLILGNGNASCRFYFTQITNEKDETSWLWNTSVFFTRELQEPISTKASLLP